MGTPRITGVRRRYSDDDRVFALRWLDVRGGNLSMTARELGVPVQTLFQWSRGTRMAGMIRRSTRHALEHLRVFRGRSIPVWCLGEVIPLDLSRLTEKEHTEFNRLLNRADRPASMPTGTTPSPFNLNAIRGLGAVFCHSSLSLRRATYDGPRDAVRARRLGGLFLPSRRCLSVPSPSASFPPLGEWYSSNASASSSPSANVRLSNRPTAAPRRRSTSSRRCSLRAF